MADVPRPITGHCLCGGVSYSVDAQPVWFEPTVEIWTSSAQPWAPHFENVARHERIPE